MNNPFVFVFVFVFKFLLLRAGSRIFQHDEDIQQRKKNNVGIRRHLRRSI